MLNAMGVVCVRSVNDVRTGMATYCVCAVTCKYVRTRRNDGCNTHTLSHPTDWYSMHDDNTNKLLHLVDLKTGEVGEQITLLLRVCRISVACLILLSTAYIIANIAP